MEAILLIEYVNPIGRNAAANGSIGCFYERCT